MSTETLTLDAEEVRAIRKALLIGDFSMSLRYLED